MESNNVLEEQAKALKVAREKMVSILNSDVAPEVAQQSATTLIAICEEERKVNRVRNPEPVQGSSSSYGY